MAEQSFSILHACEVHVKWIQVGIYKLNGLMWEWLLILLTNIFKALKAAQAVMRKTQI